MTNAWLETHNNKINYPLDTNHILVDFLKIHLLQKQLVWVFVPRRQYISVKQKLF